MPLDGTRLDEATQTLIKARTLIEQEGWIIGIRWDRATGARCALGAIGKAMGIADTDWLNITADQSDACQRLAASVPKELHDPKGNSWTVANFNNSLPDTDAVLDWFDRAIANAP